MRNTYVRKCNYHLKTHFYQTTPQTPVSADKNLECICSLASNNSDKNAKIREADAMGVKNAITADKSITTKFNRRHKAALASPLKIDTFSILKNRFELMLKFVSLYCSKTTKLTL